MTRTLTRRNFLRLSGAAAAGLALYSGELERHDLEVTRRTITLAHLPEAFHGFTIAQISDIHFQEYTEAFFLQRVIKTANELAARSGRTHRRLHYRRTIPFQLC